MNVYSFAFCFGSLRLPVRERLLFFRFISFVSASTADLLTYLPVLVVRSVAAIVYFFRSFVFSFLALVFMVNNVIFWLQRYEKFSFLPNIFSFLARKVWKVYMVYAS